MMDEVINNLLIQRLEATVNLPFHKRENTFQTDELDTTAVYVRSTYLPATPEAMGLGPNGTIGYRGLFQVDVIGTIGAGITEMAGIADSIAAQFPRGTTLSDGTTKVHIDLAYRESGREFSNDYMVPVVIRWQSYN